MWLIRLIKYYLYAKSEPWYDELMWCPTQITKLITVKGERFEIYLRWRHDDPFTGTLRCLDRTNEKGNPKSYELDLKYWRESDNLNHLKKDALNKAKWRMIKEGLI